MGGDLHNGELTGQRVWIIIDWSRRESEQDRSCPDLAKLQPKLLREEAGGSLRVV